MAISDIKLRLHRLYRHPMTRLGFAYSLQLINLLVSGSIVLTTCLAAFSWLNLGLLLCSLGVVIALNIRNMAQKATANLKSDQEMTKEFDSNARGKKITETIKSLCMKLNIPLPARALVDDLGSRNAAATGWPYTNVIQLPRLMYNKIVDKMVAIKEIKSTLAHELAHIYYKHSLHYAILSKIQRYHHLVFCFFFGLLCVNLFTLLSCFVIPALATSTPALAQSFILVSACTILLKSIEILSELANHIVARAQETQADLKSCEISNPSDEYLYHMVSEHNQQPTAKRKEIAENEGAFCFLPPVIYNFLRNGYLTSHPDATQRKQDIRLFFPEAAKTEEKYTKSELESKYIRKVY